MTLAGTAGRALMIAGALFLSVAEMLSASAEAARPSQSQALAACRAKFGNGITSAAVKKSGQIVCQEGPGPGATREEVFEWCKKTFSATTVTVRKKKGGKWECRYYGRY